METFVLYLQDDGFGLAIRVELLVLELSRLIEFPLYPTVRHHWH